MKEVWIADIESNGLLDTITKIWCIFAINYETDECVSFVLDEVFTPECKLFLEDPNKTFVFHNGINFDTPALKQILDINLVNPIIDTLVWSRVLDPDRSWGHNLENWGKHLKHEKIFNEEWETYHDTIPIRCKEDVVILKKVYSILLQEYEANAKLFQRLSNLGNRRSVRLTD